MTAGLDRSWRRLSVEAVVQPGSGCSTPAVAPATLRSPPSERGAASPASTSRPRCSAGAQRSPTPSTWVQGDLLALPFPDARFDAATVGFGVRNVADLEPGSRSSRRGCAPAADSRSSRSPSLAGSCAVLLPLVRPCRAAARQGAARRRRVHVPPRERRRFPDAEAARRAPRRNGFERVRFRLLGGTIVALHTAVRPCAPSRPSAPRRARRGTSTRSRRGSRRWWRGHPGSSVGGARGRARRGRGSASARYLRSSPRPTARRRRSRKASRSSSSTWRRSSMTTSSTAPGAPRPRVGLDGARRRGGARRPATISSPGRSPSSRPRRPQEASRCWRTPRSRSPAVRRSSGCSGTTPRRRSSYLERCALKTGRLFEAACLLGGGSGDLRPPPRIAFQIVDDILDCAGDTIETGKIPGTDLREGRRRCRCSSPLRRTSDVRARAGRRLARGRARAGRLDRRARPLPRDRARLRAARAREPRRAAATEELEALALAVVDRNG